MRRSWCLLPAVAAAGMLWFGCGGDSGAPNEPEPTDTIPVNWVSSAVVYDTLMEKKDHSFIMFSATWCGWCRKLEYETFGDSTVAAIIDESFNAVKIDIDADSTVAWFDSTVTCGALSDLFEVRGIPTVVLFDRQGTAIARITGYRSAEDYAVALRNVRDEM